MCPGPSAACFRGYVALGELISCFFSAHILKLEPGPHMKHIREVMCAYCKVGVSGAEGATLDLQELSGPN